ncbi:MAG: transcription elongation factor GreA [Candidatus Levyibacteriota bacterium]
MVKQSLMVTRIRALKRIPFTKEGYSKLEKKLARLKSDRPAAVKELARARELGDLSENGLYTAAKARLISIDNQIFRTEMTLKLADVVENTNSDIISIGSKVTVSQDGENTEYTIVGDTETNPGERKISQHSPIGLALLGKSVGEMITVSLPGGLKTFKVVKIST